MQEITKWDFFFFFLLFLGPHLRHMEVPKLGVESELQLLAYATAHGNTGSLTHSARSGIEPATSWFLVRFVSSAPRQELPRLRFLTNALRLASSTKGENWEVNGANNLTFTNIFSHVYKYEIKGMRRLYVQSQSTCVLCNSNLISCKFVLFLL